MSSFCWCIIKVDENSNKNFPNKYKNNNICCIFDRKKNRFLDEPLNANEIFCNIACGYDSLPLLSSKGILNNDSQFFGFFFPKMKKGSTIDVMNLAKSELKKRLETFQNVILNIYNTDSVHHLTLYFTETSNEKSLFEYQYMDWEIDKIASKMYKLIEDNLGIPPAFTLELKKR